MIKFRLIITQGLQIFSMKNNDYLLKAAIKKVTEKLNELVSEKIEEATIIAQDAPEIIKKEFDTLKKAIVEEAERMEQEMNINKNAYNSESYQDRNLSEVLDEIQKIDKAIEQLNSKMNNSIL